MNIMKDKPDLSIIICAYNDELFLEQAIDSAINQKDLNTEIIIVNNGSTDGSIDIINSYLNNYKNISVINKNNNGPGGARNAGLMAARGDYVVYLDGDDYFVNNSLSSVYNIAKSSNCDVCMFSAYKNDNGNIIEYGPQIEMVFEDGKDAFYALRKNKEYFAVTWLFMVKKKFVIDNKIFQLENVVYEDIEYVFSLFNKCKKIQCLCNRCYFYRKNNNSIMNTERTDYENFVSLEEVYNKMSKTKIDVSNKIIKKELLKYIKHFGYKTMRCYIWLNKNEKEKIIEKKKRFINNIFNIKLFYYKSVVVYITSPLIKVCYCLKHRLKYIFTNI